MKLSAFFFLQFTSAAPADSVGDYNYYAGSYAYYDDDMSKGKKKKEQAAQQAPAYDFSMDYLYSGAEKQQLSVANAGNAYNNHNCWTCAETNYADCLANGQMAYCQVLSLY